MAVGTSRNNLQSLNLLLYAVLFYLLYSSAYARMIEQWDSPDYNYCYLIPLVVGYLVWERQRFSQLAAAPSWVGGIPLLFGVLLYFLGELGGEFYSLYFSSWLMLVGLLWLHVGWQKLRRFAYPLCFLVAMFPFPNVINNSLSLHLKMISSTLGVQFLQSAGVAVFQAGNLIDLGFTQLEVAEACSGLRYFFPLILVGIVLAFQHPARWWQRVLLVATAAPLSILINSLRIALMVWLFPTFGEKVLQGAWHDFLGWLIFMASVLALYGLRELVLKSWPAPPAKPMLASNVKRLDTLSRPQATRPVWLMTLIAVALMGGTAVATNSINFREEVTLERPLIDFPVRLGEWQGSRLALEPKILDVLKLSDYLLTDYRNEQGHQVNMYVAFNSSQKKGESTHSPESCLPGSGWIFEESGTVALPVGPQGAEATVKRVIMRQQQLKMVGYYWFPQRGRVLTNIYQLKWYAFLDALTRQRTDGALVRFVTPVASGESAVEAEARLQDFLALVAPELNRFLPES